MAYDIRAGYRRHHFQRLRLSPYGVLEVAADAQGNEGLADAIRGLLSVVEADPTPIRSVTIQIEVTQDD